MASGIITDDFEIVKPVTNRPGLRHPPMAFTEHGILMLSSILNSKRAVQVNIEIMRAFVRLRQLLASNAETLSPIR